MQDEKFDMLGEEDLTLLSKRFERMYTNRKDARRSSGMCYRCGKHGHFIAECLEAMEVKPDLKHRPRTDHKHRLRDDYKGKNKSVGRPKRNGGHKKKERAMVAGASDINSSSDYSSSSSSYEEENDTRENGQARTTIAHASTPKAFAAWHIAPQARRATRMTRALTPRKR
jgi:hypothetical protein